MNKDKKEKKITRREFIKIGIGASSLILFGGFLGKNLFKSVKNEYVWQLDPNKCVQCGNCSTECVLNPSAVKCVHAFAMCGYCDLCSGYLKPKVPILGTAAEYRLCPTSAIKRKFIEKPYYEYTIDESLCTGCAKCVKGCQAFGNGSLFLQVRHDRCLNCNQCNIARQCPAGAYTRISLKTPYLFKGEFNKIQDKWTDETI